jgi:osmotically-inducible protein OsmY
MKTDIEIQKDVMDELKWEPLLNASEIGVAVKNGIVTLSGTVDTYGKKIAAENAAKGVLGVKAVAEDIEVKLSFIKKKNDTEVAEAVLNAFRWHASVPDDKIKIKAENGWVTLEGEVDFVYQKDAAKNIVENLTGVEGVSDFITVKPVVTTNDIREQIASAFYRSATIDSKRIGIEIRGNKAILSGKVHSWTEKNDAEIAASKARGITSVENKLVVDTGVLSY